MDYLISWFYPSSLTSSINNENGNENGDNIKILKINKIDITYTNECKVINEFLEKRNSTQLFTPGGGGCHDMNDIRVKQLYNDAMSDYTYNEFINEINLNLPYLLRKEIKCKNNLTKKCAKSALMNYLIKTK